MTEQLKLKPCPFCGREAIIRKLYHNSIPVFWVECSHFVGNEEMGGDDPCYIKCSTLGYGSPEVAAAWWNVRAKRKTKKESKS